MSAETLAKFIAQHSERGLPQSFDYQSLRALGYTGSLGEYERAADKLDHDGFASVTDKGDGKRLTVTYDLYWEYDQPVTGGDPIADSTKLAKLAVKQLGPAGAEKGGTLDAVKLQQDSGFPPRRFNPAFAYICEEFADELRGPETKELVASSLKLARDDVATLRDLAE